MGLGALVECRQRLSRRNTIDWKVTERSHMVNMFAMLSV